MLSIALFSVAIVEVNCTSHILRIGFYLLVDAQNIALNDNKITLLDDMLQPLTIHMV